jgi:hypothetical protein
LRDAISRERAIFRNQEIRPRRERLPRAARAPRRKKKPSEDGFGGVSQHPREEESGWLGGCTILGGRAAAVCRARLNLRSQRRDRHFPYVLDLARGRSRGR